MYDTLHSVDRQSCEVKVKVKWSRYRPGVAQRVGRGIALLFNDHGTIRGWVVSSTPRPHFTTGKDPVPILQEAGWAPGSVWTGGKSRPHRDSIPNRPSRSSVAMPTELPGPPIIQSVIYKHKQRMKDICWFKGARVRHCMLFRNFLKQLAIKSSTAYSNGLFQCQFEPSISKLICYLKKQLHPNIRHRQSSFLLHF